MISDGLEFHFYPVSYSDHDVFSFSFKNPLAPDFGPSYWKFNDNLLNDQTFVNNFRKFYTYHMRKFNVSLTAWDDLKEKIKTFCILYCKKKSKEKFDHLRYLPHKYSVLVQCENTDPGKYFEQLETLKLQIKNLENESMFGSKIRAKVEILENEEKPSNYFCKVEQQKSKTRLFQKLK